MSEFLRRQLWVKGSPSQQALFPKMLYQIHGLHVQFEIHTLCAQRAAEISRSVHNLGANIGIRTFTARLTVSPVG